MMEKEIETRRARMQQLNSQAQDLVDAGHFDPNAVEETRIVMEERFVVNSQTELEFFLSDILQNWSDIYHFGFSLKHNIVYQQT